ncbi:hypothetical protein BXY66_1512 [Shimia isoporae]|uniref:Uncharacterized protein n=1 Tax=Shimia isoporae TaxID=647720 RepID=A0A4R1NMC0_9RHOB|nr:DUF5692 family protein [Shimia isoporae]TCL09464.1 hypothetical protein BXY66_1512 [Shimia isoporae]
MGILYEPISLQTWGILAAVLLGLMAFSELGRTSKWGGLFLFLALPIGLTALVWPTTAALGNEHGTGTWFVWVKTYSALAGCLWFMAIRYIPYLQDKKWALALPAIILAVNILEACIRDFEVYSFGLWEGGYVDHLWMMSGPWNIMNGIAGLLNIVAISGWLGIYVTRDVNKDMIWPDQIWAWILAYDLWNFAYVYNCIADHSIYAGAVLLLACTIPAFLIKKGAWLQYRAHTLGLWTMFVMTFPMFADKIAPVQTTHDPRAFFWVSFVALMANIALVAWHGYRIVKYKRNPLRDEIYAGTKEHAETSADRQHPVLA